MSVKFSLKLYVVLRQKVAVGDDTALVHHLTSEIRVWGVFSQHEVVRLVTQNFVTVYCEGTS
jgi:hypothetical protein